MPNDEVKLLDAARTGGAALVSCLLNQSPGTVRVNIDCTDAKGNSPLILATRNDHVRIVEMLCDAGASTDQVTKDGNSALIWAASIDKVNIVKVLLKAGANVNYARPRGSTALTLAAQKGHTRVVKVLIAAGAMFDHTKDDGKTALMLAAESGHWSTAEVLLTSGADVNQRTILGSTTLELTTALTLAAEFGRVNVVEVLLGASVEIKYMATALIGAACEGYASIVQLLLEAGANEMIRSADKRKAISEAEKHRHHDIAEMLRKYDGSATAAFAAIASNDMSALKVLTDDHKNARGTNDRTLLHVAASRGRFDMVELLVQRGANINIRDINEWSALHHAAKKGHVLVVKFLLASRCRFDIPDSNGRPPIMTAVIHGHVDVVRELHDHGASLKCVDHQGSTLFHHAARDMKSTAVLEYLLTKCKSATEAMSSRDLEECVPLHIAVQADNVEAVSMLIAHGADANVQNEAGETPLILASAEGNTSIVTTLLTHGARVDLATSCGETALSVVKSPKIQSVLEIYDKSQQFHERCMTYLSSVDSKPTKEEILSLVPLITSVYDLRHYVAVVSCTYVSDMRKNAERTHLLDKAFGDVANSKLVYDLDAITTFKAELEHKDVSQWLPRKRFHRLDRVAELVNNESAEWVTDLKNKVHNHSWRLDAHEHSVRRLVSGVKQVFGMVLENRATFKAVCTRIDRIQKQVNKGMKLMGQLIEHGNQLSDRVQNLTKRLQINEKNLTTIATGLHDFRTAYVSRLDREAKIKKIKRIGGVVAAIAGFVFAPVLKEAYETVVEWMNPIEVFGLAYPGTDVVNFLKKATPEHALEPLIESQFEKLMIPKEEFDTLLREALVLQDPELLNKCTPMEIEDLIASSKAEYAREVQLSLESRTSEVDALLTEVELLLGTCTIPTPSKEMPSSHSIQSRRWHLPLMDPSSDCHELESVASVTTIKPRSFEESRMPVSCSRDTDINVVGGKVIFVDDLGVFPYHAAVHKSNGQLDKFLERVARFEARAVDITATMSLQLVSHSTTKEFLCAAEYAYCLGHRAVGDVLLARMADATDDHLARIRSTTQAQSVKLLEKDDDFTCVYIVNECGGNATFCGDLCDVHEDDNFVIDAKIAVEVVRDRSVDVRWSAVEYAAHLGYVKIVSQLLKIGSNSPNPLKLSREMKTQLLKQAKKRADEIKAGSTKEHQ